MQHSVYFQAATMFKPSTATHFHISSTASCQEFNIQMVKREVNAEVAPSESAQVSFEMPYYTQGAVAPTDNQPASRAIEKRKALKLAIGETYVYVKIADILRCEGQGAYTRIFLKNRKPLLVSKSLKGYAGLLEGHGFARVHQSHLISLDEVDQFIKSDGGYILLKDGSKIPVSRSKRQAFLEMMDTVQI